MNHVAVCFFGITRSLKYTIGSIEKNVLVPARRLSHVTVCAHLFQQAQITNPRSSEVGRVDLDEYLLLQADRLELEPPDLCLGQMEFEHLQTYGDAWDDGFRSLRNLLHQLHSLDRVTTLARESGAETIVFVRPDLMYHDSISYALRGALRSEGSAVWLPSWQRWSGENDRFAIARGQRAIEVYGRRGREALQFCRSQLAPLNGEALLSWWLNENRIDKHDIDVCASRVRIDGNTAPNDVFRGYWWRLGARWARRMGVKPLIRWLIR